MTRTITIDFQNKATSDYCLGYIGENNATKLKIIPSDELKNDSRTAGLYLAYEVGEQIIPSSTFQTLDGFEVYLQAQLTQKPCISIQLIAVDTNQAFIGKTEFMRGFKFKPSAKSVNTQPIADDTTLITQIQANSAARHTHSNKALLDTYTQTEANLSDAVSKKHSHSNKTLIDAYTQTEENLSDAVSKKHSHSNASILDNTTESYTTEEKQKVTDAYSDRHIHSNASILNNTTASFTTEKDTALSGKEDKSNKVTSVMLPGATDTQYPSAKAVQTAFNSLYDLAASMIPKENAKTAPSSQNKVLTEAEIDDELIQGSDNAVSGGIVYNAFVELSEEIEDIEDTIDQIEVAFGTKADKTALALTDKKLKYLYDLTQGQAWDTEQDTSTAYSKSVTSGAKAVAVEKIGGKTIAWNQLCPSAQNMYSNWTKTGINKTIENDEITLTSTTNTVSVKALTTNNLSRFDISHTFLIKGEIQTDGTTKAAFGFYQAGWAGAGAGTGYTDSSSWTTMYGVGTPTSPAYFGLRLVNSTVTGGWAKFRNLQLIDLTLLGDSLVTDYATFHQHYPADYYEYNAGTLISTPVTSVVSKKSDNTVLGTLNISSELRTYLSDKGYGQSNGETYNYIDFEQKKYYKFGSYVDGVWTTDEQVYDISSYLSDDNLLTVEANGTLTFPNTNGDNYKVGVPSTETFAINLSEAVSE